MNRNDGTYEATHHLVVFRTASLVPSAQGDGRIKAGSKQRELQKTDEFNAACHGIEHPAHQFVFQIRQALGNLAKWKNERNIKWQLQRQ